MHLHVGSLDRMVPDLAKEYYQQETVVNEAVELYLCRRHACNNNVETKLQPAHRLLMRRADMPFVKGTPRRRVYWVHALYAKGDVFVKVLPPMQQCCPRCFVCDVVSVLCTN